MALTATSTRTRTVIAAAWLLFWLMMVSVAVEDYLRDHGRHLWQPVLWESSSMIAATVLMLVQRRLARPYDVLLAQPWRWFGVQALFLPMYWICFVPIAFGIRHAVYALAGMTYTHEGWANTYFYESLKLTVFIGLFTLAYFGVLSYGALLEAKLRAERANALLRQADLHRLRQQMQPHFLFNALNTISSLMHSDIEKADATLIQLADVLRATLDVSEVHEAPLATELRLVRGYARVMEERYAERVAICWQIDDDALDCRLPVMSMQPLLENIFKHTVEQRRKPTRIHIAAAREHGKLVVTLDDDSGQLPEHGGSGGEAGSGGDAGNGGEAGSGGEAGNGNRPGIGLANLRARMAMLYGDGASLALSQLQPAGVRARMELPCAS